MTANTRVSIACNHDAAALTAAEALLKEFGAKSVDVVCLPAVHVVGEVAATDVARLKDVVETRNAKGAPALVLAVA